jgi:phytoene synthase
LLNSYKTSHFAPAFLFLSAERRRALKLLYAVCRTLDDAADQGRADAAQYLEAWKKAFVSDDAEAVASFGQKELAREFLETVRRYDMPKHALIDLIDRGVALDLSPQRFQTPFDTENYCYGVAGMVGFLCLPLFGVPWQEAKDFAIRLGIAVQWTNLVRDVGADAKMG